jgi:3-oxoacyl-[acyl-carrier-protein] synthase II
MEGMLRETILPTINYVPDPEIHLDNISDRHLRCSQEFLLKMPLGLAGCNACIVFQRKTNSRFNSRSKIYQGGKAGIGGAQ